MYCRCITKGLDDISLLIFLFLLVVFIYLGAERERDHGFDRGSVLHGKVWREESEGKNDVIII